MGHLKTHKLTVKLYKQKFEKAVVVSPLTRRRMQLSRWKFILSKRNNKSEKPRTNKSIKLAIANLGRKHYPETIEKIRKAHLGSKLSSEHKLAISIGLLGHKVSDATKLKLSQKVVPEECRRRISEAQSAEKGNAWKGGVSRYLYSGKNKFRLKKIFGDPLKCFFPGCGKAEGKEIRSVDCHHIDGDHANNPLDGSNWLPLCRRHHMLADGRLKGATPNEIAKAAKISKKAHSEYMKHNYIGEVKNYYD